MLNPPKHSESPSLPRGILSMRAKSQSTLPLFDVMGNPVACRLSMKKMKSNRVDLRKIVLEQRMSVKHYKEDQMEKINKSVSLNSDSECSMISDNSEAVSSTEFQELLLLMPHLIDESQIGKYRVHRSASDEALKKKLFEEDEGDAWLYDWDFKEKAGMTLPEEDYAWWLKAGEDIEGDPRMLLSNILEYDIDIERKLKNKKMFRHESAHVEIKQQVEANNPAIGTPAKKKVSIDDFEIIKGLSSGAYGKVCLVKKKNTGDCFALKIIDREKTLAKNQEDLIRSELEILKRLNNDYVVKLYYTFQNDEYLYFVMEYMNGGDFGNLLQKCSLTEDDARLYLAEIVAAVEHLHANNILHRDIKPENILIDATGHLKITDFGLSKCGYEARTLDWITSVFNRQNEIRKIKESASLSHGRQPQKKRFVGTPYYLAPELILGQEATVAADWWAVGIIAFEMMVGETPYQGDTPEEIFHNTTHDNKAIIPSIGFGDDQISADAYSLISQLMDHNPNKRLGTKGPEEIKLHAFFKGLEWDKLRTMKPAFVPKVSGTNDTGYFPKSKSIKIEDFCAKKPINPEPGKLRKRSSMMLDLCFDSTNTKTLAAKNKEDARKALEKYSNKKSKNNLLQDYFYGDLSGADHHHNKK